MCGGFGLVGNDNQWVNLQVCELAIDVNSVQAGYEVYQDIVNALGNLFEKGSSNLVVGGVFGKIYWDQELLCLGVYVANINTAFVGK